MSFSTANHTSASRVLDNHMSVQGWREIPIYESGQRLVSLNEIIEHNHTIKISVDMQYKKQGIQGSTILEGGRSGAT
jgi:hypothetical protein